MDMYEAQEALREMQGCYVGNRPLKLRKSNWDKRNYAVKKKKSKKHLFWGHKGILEEEWCFFYRALCVRKGEEGENRACVKVTCTLGGDKPEMFKGSARHELRFFWEGEQEEEGEEEEEEMWKEGVLGGYLD